MPEGLLSTPWSPSISVTVLLLASVVTVAGSVRLVLLGDELSDRTGWGQALFGAVFFGFVTSLSGIVMTATAAASNEPAIAYSNAVGGIVAQTTAIAVADWFYRRSNLEHAAASSSNIFFGCLLTGLLALSLAATYMPDVTVLGVHVASPLIVAFYVGGLKLAQTESRQPMWQAVITAETRTDRSALEVAKSSENQLTARRLWTEFAAIGVVVACGGWLVATAGESLVQLTGLRAGFVGGVLMGLINALPETITAVAAVRRGAVTLAVAAILGGNCLDALNLVVGDVAYRQGSLFHAAGSDELFVTAAAIVMTATVLSGMLIRQARGWGGVGFEGVVLLVSYLGTVAVLAT